MIVDIRLHAVLDPTRTRGRPLADMARAAIAGGATLLQYRDKEASTRDMIERARALVAVVEGTRVPLLVNDCIDVALAARAHGVHVGQDDMRPQDVRRLMGPDAIVGLTVKTAEHAAKLPVGLVSYACIGGVFASLSKRSADRPVGLDGLADLAARLRARAPDLPIGAIAGVTAANAAEVIAAGTDGVAVISEIFMADDPEAATRRLRRVVDDALAARDGGSRP